MTLLLEVTPPDHKRPLRQYEDAFDPHTPLPRVPVVVFEGEHLLKAVFQNLMRPISAGTCSILKRPPKAGSLKASNPLQSSKDGPQNPPNPPKLPLHPPLIFKIAWSWPASTSGGNFILNL